MDDKNIDLIDSLLHEAKSEETKAKASVAGFLRNLFRKRKNKSIGVAVSVYPRFLAILNKSLAIAVVLVTLSFPMILWMDAQAIGEFIKIPEPEIKPREETPAETGEQKRQSAWQFRRQYFRGISNSQISGSNTPLDAATTPGLAQRYSLIGILTGAIPKAIIKENLSGNTMFLSKNQRMDTYTVQEIKSDRIVLEQDGELFELKM